jgi:hypothetical protein
MAKSFKLLFLCLFVYGVSSAQQDLPGFRTDNYAGVNSVFFNPAAIAGSKYRWDVNVIGVDANVGNNQAKYSLGDLGNAFDGDKVKDQIFGKNAGATSGLASVAIHLPSVMVSVGNKMAFAFTTRARVLGNVTDMDGKLVDKISDETNDPTLPYTINSNSNMRVNVNGWTEFGLSFAREVYATGPHRFKAGATLKYLAGLGNVNVHLSNFKGTIDEDLLAQDAYLTNTTAKVGLASSGVNIADFEASQLTKISGHGVGLDLGVQYEFQPEGEKSYRLKVGVAVLDIGRVKFDKDMQHSAGYNLSVAPEDKFYLSQLSNVSLSDYKSTFDQYPQYFSPDGSGNVRSYTASLPTTMQLTADYHIEQHFYVNANVQIAMSKGESKPYNGQYYSGFSVTPRYESRKFGFYLPLNYNGLTKFNAGLALRAGPVYLGSGSVLTALAGNSKQADVFIGFRFGQLYRKARNK